MKKEAERDVVKPKICQLEESEDADVKKYFKGETNTKNENSTKKETSPKKETNVKKETDVKMKPTRLGPRSRLTSSNNAIVSFLKKMQGERSLTVENNLALTGKNDAIKRKTFMISVQERLTIYPSIIIMIICWPQ